MVHPRHASERQIERRRRRVGRSGDEQQCPLGGEARHIGAALVADEQFYAGGIARDHQSSVTIFIAANFCIPELLRA
jgi:hypothetical protein